MLRADEAPLSLERTVETEMVFEPVRGGELRAVSCSSDPFETTEFPLPSVSPIKPFFVWGQQWAVITSAGEGNNMLPREYKVAFL